MTEKEYIERNALIAEYDRVHIGAPGGARKLMVDAPAADVVEVVRCEDCKHGNTKPYYDVDEIIYGTTVAIFAVTEKRKGDMIGCYQVA